VRVCLAFSDRFASLSARALAFEKDLRATSAAFLAFRATLAAFLRPFLAFLRASRALRNRCSAAVALRSAAPWSRSATCSRAWALRRTESTPAMRYVLSSLKRYPNEMGSIPQTAKQ
jgi:hypothetical protein